jgi:hypothetical protein
VKTNKKRLIQNLLLLIAVAGLGYFVATKEQDRGELHQTLYDKSFGDEVTKITLHTKGADDVILENINDIWKVTQPEKFDADSQKVRQLFTLLSENADSEYNIKGKDLAKYGLDKNNLSIRFDEVLLIFGDYNEVTQQRYILKGDKMYLVNEAISGLIQFGAEGFKKP